MGWSVDVLRMLQIGEWVGPPVVSFLDMYTVLPRYNDPGYNDNLGITTVFWNFFKINMKSPSI